MRAQPFVDALEQPARNRQLVGLGRLPLEFDDEAESVGANLIDRELDNDHRVVCRGA